MTNRGLSATAVVAAAVLLCVATAAEGRVAPSRCSILKAGVRCPKGDNGVACFANPCDASCPAHPDAQCVASYCEKFYYQGKEHGPCAAIWVNPRTCKEVSCKKPCPLINGAGSLQCPADDPEVKCQVNPCAFTTCAVGATCVPNYCSKPVTVNGYKPKACEAVCIDESKCSA